MKRQEGKRRYVIAKDFNTFMYDHTLHRGKKTFLPLLCKSFQNKKILKRYIKDFSKINDKQRIRMSTKSEYIRFKTLKEK